MITPLIESLQNDLNEGLPIETFVSAEILQDLLNAALRLAAIEGAGDGDIRNIFAEMESLCPNAKIPLMSLESIVKYERLKASRTEIELAELREKLKEAEKAAEKVIKILAAFVGGELTRMIKNVFTESEVGGE